MSRRVWVVGIVAGALVLTAGGAVAYVATRPGCGEAVTRVSAAESRSPFLDAEERAEQPDADRDRLVATLDSDPAPIGEVVGAVGYHYEQWAQVSAYAQGIGVRTRDNADFTMLDDESLDPLWSVQVDTRRSAYDASDSRYLVATMPSASAPDLVSMDADNGRRVWCTTLGETPLRADDAFATQLLKKDDVAVLRADGKVRERLARLNARDGSRVWERTLDAGEGDFLGTLEEDTLLVGGRPQYLLFDAADLAKRQAGTTLELVSATTGKTLWTRRAAAGSDVHVLGTDPGSGTAVLIEANARATRLLAIDAKGNERWAAVPAAGKTFDAALRAGRVLVRAGNRWSAYAVDGGRRIWTRVVPDRPQYLPYGFELDSIPMLDDNHALIGGTTALHTLDLRTGLTTSAPLPTDGINTTFWPYQVAVSAGLIAVATNTGAAVVRRE